MSFSSRKPHVPGVTKVTDIINRLAINHLPADAPAFLRSEAALSEIEYLGPEPDRWRSPAEPELVAAQAPEHFIDLEPADALGPLPRRRFDFEASVFASGQRPEKIGLQPWEATEVWERLKAALREYRRLTDRTPGYSFRRTGGHLLRRLARALRRRCIAAAPHHRAIQRLDRS